MESYHQQGIKVRTILIRVTLLKPSVPQLLGLRRTNRTAISSIFLCFSLLGIRSDGSPIQLADRPAGNHSNRSSRPRRWDCRLIHHPNRDRDYCCRRCCTAGRDCRQQRDYYGRNCQPNSRGTRTRSTPRSSPPPPNGSGRS
jgi:hypothetical protein